MMHITCMIAIIGLVCAGDIANVRNCSCSHPQRKGGSIGNTDLIATDLAKNACSDNRLGRFKRVSTGLTPPREPVVSLPDDPTLRSCVRCREVTICEFNWKSVCQADRKILFHKRSCSPYAAGGQ